MLALLLDEHISPIVAERIRARKPSILIQGIHHWHSGTLCGTPDSRVLEAAAEERRTLVTFDLKTVPPALSEWAALGRAHGGVVLVDQRTIRPEDFSRLVRALEQLWEREHARAWADRIVFLEAP